MVTLVEKDTVSTTAIKFVGTGFQTLTDYTAKAKYLGVEATSVVVTSDTEALAEFANGVPLSSVSQKAFLYFTWAVSPIQHYAVNVNLTNAATVAALDAPVSCSFAGGCSISISQSGLLTNLLSDPARNNIRVCGQLCKIDTAASTASQVKCTLPPMATTASIDQFKIVSESYISGVAFSSRPTDEQATMSVWDGSHQNGWRDNAANCFFGTAFRLGYIGVLNEVKYFMSRFVRSNFEFKLRFEGSMTGASNSWVTIFTVGREIHEGWNYYNFPAGKELKYRYYRFFGPSSGSCVVGEVSLRGYEAIDSTADSYVCKANMTINGVVPPV